MKRILINVTAVILFLLVSTATCLADGFNPPWEAPEETRYRELKSAPAPKKTARDDKADSLETNTLKIPFIWWLSFYKKYISPTDGDKCGMYPTCSGYSTRAIKKHGAAIGIMMTVDRLLHEGTEQKRAPLIKKFGVLRFYDPLENNDFWFTESK